MPMKTFGKLLAQSSKLLFFCLIPLHICLISSFQFQLTKLHYMVCHFGLHFFHFIFVQFQYSWNMWNYILATTSRGLKVTVYHISFVHCRFFFHHTLISAFCITPLTSAFFVTLQTSALYITPCLTPLTSAPYRNSNPHDFQGQHLLPPRGLRMPLLCSTHIIIQAKHWKAITSS